MSRPLEDYLFPMVLGLSLASHGALTLLRAEADLSPPDFEVEERMAVEPMTVRIIQTQTEAITPAPTETPLPLLTSDSGTRQINALDLAPVAFEERRPAEPTPPRQIEPPMDKPEPEEPPPVEEPVELPQPTVEEPPPPKAIEPPKPNPAAPKEVPVQTGPVEQESQSGVTSRAVPNARGNRAPRYPRRARAAKMQGTTILAVTVRPDGTVERATVHKSSGHALLDDEALKAVKRWRFTPAKTSSGARTEDRVRVPVTFKLK